MRRSEDEFKAEVFRRSSMYIQQRKKNRNRILACCIPVVLCTGLIFAVIPLETYFERNGSLTNEAYGNNSPENAEMFPAGGRYPDNEMVTEAMRIASVKVQSDYGSQDFYRYYTVSEKVEAITAVIQDMIESGEMTGSEIPTASIEELDPPDATQGEINGIDGVNGTDRTDRTDGTDNEIYRITLMDVEGNITEYLLTEEGLYICSEQKMLLAVQGVAELNRLLQTLSSDE